VQAGFSGQHAWALHGAASQMEASQMTYYYLTNDKGQMLAKDFKFLSLIIILKPKLFDIGKRKLIAAIKRNIITQLNG
jgi:hypothetical protein